MYIYHSTKGLYCNICVCNVLYRDYSVRCMYIDCTTKGLYCTVYACSVLHRDYTEIYVYIVYCKVYLYTVVYYSIYRIARSVHDSVDFLRFADKRVCVLVYVCCRYLDSVTNKDSTLPPIPHLHSLLTDNRDPHPEVDIFKLVRISYEVRSSQILTLSITKCFHGFCLCRIACLLMFTVICRSSAPFGQM